jgi:pimeloyl-ACP methyl ester carboxylesterase
VKEKAFLFGERRSLVGILTEPGVYASNSPITGAVAVILLNAGILHRVGPGRLYVTIARELAALGFTAFRFDFSSIGDSKPRHDNLPFDKSSVDETQRAMDLLESEQGIRRFILIGGCSGARVSLATTVSDPRVSAAIMMNFPAWLGQDDDPDLPKRKDEHYYLSHAIRDYRSWCNFFRGEAHYRKIFGALTFCLRRRFAREKSAASETLALRQSFESIAQRGVRIIFVYSNSDPGLEDLRQTGGRTLRKLCSFGKAQIIVIPRSDHTFSSLSDQERLVEVLRKQCLDVAARAATPTADLPLAAQRQGVTQHQPSDKDECRQIASI